MSVVANYGPSTLGPSSLGGHYTDYSDFSSHNITDESDEGSLTEAQARVLGRHGFDLLNRLRQSASDAESQALTEKMVNRVVRTIGEGQDLEYDPSLEESLNRWKQRDYHAATQAQDSYNGLIDGADYFKQALFSGYIGVPQEFERPAPSTVSNIEEIVDESSDDSLGDDTRPLLPPSWETRALPTSPSTATGLTEEEIQEKADEIARGLVALQVPNNRRAPSTATALTEEEIQEKADEIARGLIAIKVPNNSSSAGTLVRRAPSSAMIRTQTPQEQMNEILRGMNAIRVPDSASSAGTMVPRTRSAQEIMDENATGYNSAGIESRLMEPLRVYGKTPHPRALASTQYEYEPEEESTQDYYRRPSTGQSIPQAMSRIGRMWESMVSQMDKSRAEIIEVRKKNAHGGYDQFRAAAESGADGEPETQVRYHRGEHANGTFESISSTFKSPGYDSAIGQGFNPLERMLTAA